MFNYSDSETPVLECSHTLYGSSNNVTRDNRLMMNRDGLGNVVGPVRVFDVMPGESIRYISCADNHVVSY